MDVVGVKGKMRIREIAVAEVWWCGGGVVVEVGTCVEMGSGCVESGSVSRWEVC